MKTEDEQDETIARLLDEAARDLQPESDIKPVLRSGSRRRVARLTAMIAAVCLFVGGIGWAGIAIKESHSSEAWRSFGTPASTTWSIRYPESWHEETTHRCQGVSPQIGGAILSNVPYVFRNPQGGVPDCGDRLILAGFPRDGVAVALMPQGIMLGLVPRLVPTPFPIRMGQFFDAGSVPGGVRSLYLPVRIGRDNPLILRVWIGPDASARDRADVVGVVRSFTMPGATRWTTTTARAEGVAASLPDDWHVSTRAGAGVLISTYAPHASRRGCRAPGPNALGGMSYADALIWIPRGGARFEPPSPAPSPPVVGTLHPVAGCRAQGFGPTDWRYVTEYVSPPFGPPIGIRVVVVYGENARREDTGRLVDLVLSSLRFGEQVAPTEGEPSSQTPEASQ